MNSRTDSNEFQGVVGSKAAMMRYLYCDFRQQVGQAQIGH